MSVPHSQSLFFLSLAGEGIWFEPPTTDGWPASSPSSSPETQVGPPQTLETDLEIKAGYRRIETGIEEMLNNASLKESVEQLKYENTKLKEEIEHLKSDAKRNFEYIAQLASEKSELHHKWLAAEQKKYKSKDEQPQQAQCQNKNSSIQRITPKN